MPVIYEIRIEGQLNPGWPEWLDEMTISFLGGSETLCLSQNNPDWG